MQSILNIVCPHCHAKGRVAAPPVGAMVIGPCPKCNELVMVFSGMALPLKKEVILRGSSEKKRQHLMEVLTTFLDQQISRLVQELDGPGSAGDEDHALDGASGNGFDMHSEDDLYGDDNGEMPLERFETDIPDERGNAISQSEFEHFVRKDLPMLDNKDYFRRTFNGG